MNADVSRALARFAAATALSRDGVRELAAQFADVGDVADLPDWVREGDAVGYDLIPGHDQGGAL